MHKQLRATINEMPQNIIAAANFLEESSTSPILPSEPFSQLTNSPTTTVEITKETQRHNKYAKGVCFLILFHYKKMIHFL